MHWYEQQYIATSSFCSEHLISKAASNLRYPCMKIIHYSKNQLESSRAFSMLTARNHHLPVQTEHKFNKFHVSNQLNDTPTNALGKIAAQPLLVSCDHAGPEATCPSGKSLRL